MSAHHVYIYIWYLLVLEMLDPLELWLLATLRVLETKSGFFANTKIALN